MGVAVVLDGGGEGFVAEDGAVEFMFGEAAEVFGDFFGGDIECGGESLAFGEFREGGSTGDGAGAAVGFPFDIGDFVIFDLDKHEHLVTTDGVANDTLGVVMIFRFVAHEKIFRV